MGVWPALTGRSGSSRILLASPIILPDYPELAPESVGDYFDATEIDEMLVLRLQTLSEEEKQEIMTSDRRGRELLERVARMSNEQMAQLHGAIRRRRFANQPEGR